VVLVKGRIDGVEVLGIQVILSDPKGIPEAKYEFLGFAIASIRHGAALLRSKSLHSSPPPHGFIL
jgi:hypothetical protein